MPVRERAEKLIRRRARMQSRAKAREALSAGDDEQWQARKRPAECAEDDATVCETRARGQENSSGGTEGVEAASYSYYFTRVPPVLHSDRRFFAAPWCNWQHVCLWSRRVLVRSQEGLYQQMQSPVLTSVT